MSGRCSACSIQRLNSFLGHCQQYRCAASFTQIPALVICLYVSRGDKRKQRKTLRQAGLFILSLSRIKSKLHPRLFQGALQPRVKAVCCTAGFVTSFALLLSLSLKLPTIYQVIKHTLCNLHAHQGPFSGKLSRILPFPPKYKEIKLKFCNFLAYYA